MITGGPSEIVRTALAKGELEKLILGAPEYQYRSRFSPAPGNTDLTELLAVVYDGLDSQAGELATVALIKALYSVVNTYEGIDAVSTCILFETGRKFDGKQPLGLPLDDLAARLQATIRTFEPQLRVDKSGGGQHWPDGRLGEFRRLSRNTVSLGGPSFCE